MKKLREESLYFKKYCIIVKMKRIKFKLFIIFLIINFVLSAISIGGLSKNIQVLEKKESSTSKDFYFVQITDTHLLYESFEKNGNSKGRFKCVLENVTSFKRKPAFIVITGDLCEWGGNGKTGALNYQTFVSCLYEKNNMLYATSEYSIPVYTIPGNHDYMPESSLKNYHTYIDKNHIATNDKYAITYGSVSLFFMNSGHDYTSHPSDWKRTKGNGLYGDDIEWLENGLRGCQTEHKIVLMHHPAVNVRDKLGEMTSVIARNREKFVELCEQYKVDLVLCGHTHTSRVFDAEENRYDNEYPIDCSKYPTLYVQSDDCKEGVHYRNISIIDDNIWLEENQKINFFCKSHNRYKRNSNLMLNNFLEQGFFKTLYVFPELLKIRKQIVLT